MRTIYILVILVLLALAVPASPAHAGGVVTVCDEAHLLAALAGGGNVTFSCSGMITLTNAIMISADTSIDGSGQDVTISGNHEVKVFRVAPGIRFNLNRVTIADGFVKLGAGGGIDGGGGELLVTNSLFTGNEASEGGAIFSYRSLTVLNSRFSGNRAGAGGGIAAYGVTTVSNSLFSDNSSDGDGGGIFNASFGGIGLTVSNSTFSGNSAVWAGGGIFSDGAVTISGSTFVDNHASRGGAISSLEGGVVTVSNSTFSGNDSDGIHIPQNAATTVINSTLAGNQVGIASFSGSVILRNTIVANSASGNNCTGTITDGGGNLTFPDTTCPGINVDPLLGPLQDNGGPTWTMALGEGSAALDAADDAICAAPPVNSLDQRGFPRPWGAHCDIGAVEQIQEPSAVSVSALRAQSPPGTITPAMIAGLLLLVLMAVGVQRRPRHIG